jgi:hypothetical protein
MKIASSDGSATSKRLTIAPAFERRGEDVARLDAGHELELGEPGTGRTAATPSIDASHVGRISPSIPRRTVRRREAASARRACRPRHGARDRR